MENLDREMCPICGKRFKFQCKCLIGERTCENGHTWFLCPIHRSVVVGKSDHGKGIGECHCTRDRCKRCGSDEINMDIETYRVKCRKCGYAEGGGIRDANVVVLMDYDIYGWMLMDAVLSNPNNCDKRTEFVKILKRFASEMAGVCGPKTGAAWRKYPDQIPDVGRRHHIILYAPNEGKDSRLHTSVYYDPSDAAHDHSVWRSRPPVYWVYAEELFDLPISENGDKKGEGR